MPLWKRLLPLLERLRPAFRCHTTFLWFVLALISLLTRSDLVGVTSFVRCLGLKENAYNAFRRLFHSKGVSLEKLRRLWTHMALEIFKEFLVTLNGRILLVCDGLKNPKEGKKMPAVKSLHQHHSFRYLKVWCSP